MPKNLFQDMVKINHTKRENHFKKDKRHEVVENFEPERVEKKERNTKRNYTLWAVASVALVFFLFALSYLFSKAEITIDPMAQDINLNENLSAGVDPGVGDVPFDLIVIPGEEIKNVPATLEKEVEQKAKGTVFIYNTFSSSPQALDIDTRLEGSNGKIYKTETRTVVPGMAKDGKPGSVEVKIYGSVAGQEYNSTPLDFKIFGFKGTPKYSKFYARSKGDIVGGFKGKSHVVSKVDKENAIVAVKDALRIKLLKKATDQIPNGFVLLKDAISLDIDDVADVELVSSGDTYPMKIKGTFYGILFEEKKLTKKIAKDTIEKYDDSDVYIPDIQNLTFSLSNKGVSFKSLKSINFNLSGAIKIVWKTNTSKLASDLLGKSKKDFNQIMSDYPNISSAHLSLSPIWRRSIPDNLDDIKILVNYP